MLTTGHLNKWNLPNSM